MQILNHPFKTAIVVILKQVCVIVPVWNDGVNWAVEVNLNFVELFLITNDDVLDDVNLVVVSVNEADVELLDSKLILTSDMVLLLQGQTLDGIVFIPFDDWLQNVSSASFEPLVAPLGEVEAVSH